MRERFVNLVSAHSRRPRQSAKRTAFLRDVGGTTSVTILATLLNATAGIVMARGLGAIGRGETATVLSWFAVLQATAEVGLTTATVYLTAQQPTLAASILLRIRRLYLVQGLTLSIIAAFALTVIPASGVIRQGLLLALLLMPAIFWLTAPIQSSQALSIFVWNVTRLAQAMIYLAAMLAITTLSSLSVSNVVVAFLLSAGAAGAISNLLLRRRKLLPRTPKDEGVAYSRIYSYAIPNWAWTLLAIAAIRLDQIALAALVPARELGIYVAALTYVALTAPLMSGIGSVTLTVFARGHSLSSSSVKSLMVYAAVTSCLASGVLALLAPAVIPILFGSQFRGAVLIALLLTPAAASAGFRQIAADLLRGRGRPGHAAVVQLAYIVTLGLAIVAGHSAAGLRGAAIGVSVASIAAALAMALVVSRVKEVI
jgi:O-antigen/teichoic acid export membrane protein